MREWREAAPGAQISLGEKWTPNIGVRPNIETESTLLEILEAVVARKYYLSRIACLGMIDLAERKNKPMPPELKAALIAQAEKA
jgi:DNA (cytosine-5)-methyltransferase 1